MSLNATPPEAILAVALFILWAVSEGAIHAVGLFQPENRPRQRAGLTWLQTAFAGGLVVGLVDSCWLRLTTFPAGLTPLCYTAGGLVLASLGLRLLARLQLGKNFSGFVQTFDEHRLVTQGVYAWVSHPAYTGFLGFLIGFPICFGSVLSLLVSLGIGLPAIAYRIREEEAALTQWFGDDYREYRQRTKRLLPFVW